MGTKNNPGNFNFYHRALADEPMFVLLARDPKAPTLVETWATSREHDINSKVRPETDRAMVREARECAAQMRRWRLMNHGAWR